MNPDLAQAALKALHDPAFVPKRGMCQQFVRQVIESIYGNDYNEYRDKSAHLAMQLWQNSEFAVEPARGSVIGDILYWRGTAANPHGHTAIRVPGNQIAENSSVHNNEIHGGKGIRNLQNMRPPALIVRLPRP